MKAFIIVDIQYDFLPGGALGITDGDKIIPLINQLQDRFDLIIATQDWHPKNHGSFASVQGKNVYEHIQLGGLDQVLWPDHCVQGTHGAELAEELRKDKIVRIFQKGTDPGIDSYSGFFDNGHKKSTGLGEYLKGEKISDIYIAGLATDYCVRYSALDAVNLGFRTAVILPASRGVNVQPDDIDNAVNEMEAKGVRIIKDTSSL